MCLQCSTKSSYYAKEVMPGWRLHRATKDAWDNEPKEWRKDEYGLVKMNDPAFTWTSTPVIDPSFDMSDEEIENLSPGVCDEFDDAVCEMEEAMIVGPMTGYSLIEAAKEAGYDPNKHGYRFSRWLVHSMGIIVRDEKLITYDDNQVDVNNEG